MRELLRGRIGVFLTAGARLWGENNKTGLEGGKKRGAGAAGGREAAKRDRSNCELVLRAGVDEEATDNANFVNSEAPQAAQESDTLAVEADAYQTSTVANVGDDQIGSAKADQTQMNDLATADAAYILACAQADKDRAVNQTNHVTDYAELYTKAIADARLSLADGQADADLAWVDGKAQADEGFLNADAANWQAIISDDAQANDQFSRLDDAAIQTQQDAVAQAEADSSQAQALADQSQATSDAGGGAAFAVAQANETATIWNWLAGELGTPWAHSQAGLAATEASWAPTASANYLQLVSELGTAEMSYATSDAGQYVTEMKSIDLADRTDSDQAADARESSSVALAADEEAFEQTSAQQGMLYQEGFAQANHGYRYAAAQAEHDLAVSGDEAAYAAAMSLAAANRSDAQNQSLSAYSTVVGPATTLQQTSDANAELIAETSENGAALDDVKQGDQWVDSYDDQEATDYDVEQRANALSLDDFKVADANGHAAAIASFAQANPTLWGENIPPGLEGGKKRGAGAARGREKLSVRELLRGRMEVFLAVGARHRRTG